MRLLLSASALLAAVAGATAATIVGTLALDHNPQNEFCAGGKTVVDGVTHWSACTLTVDFYTLLASIFGTVAVPVFLSTLGAGLIIRVWLRRWDAQSDAA